MGRCSVTCVLLVLRMACKHHLVRAPGPGLTVVFLIFLVLAQGAGVSEEDQRLFGCGSPVAGHVQHDQVARSVVSIAVFMCNM